MRERFEEELRALVPDVSVSSMTAVAHRLGGPPPVVDADEAEEREEGGGVLLAEGDPSA